MTKPKPHRAGFGPHCRLEPAGVRIVNGETVQLVGASWKDQPALNRDGTRRVFASADSARAWLAAADVTKGASARPL